MATYRSSWAQGEAFFREIPVTKLIILCWVISFLVTFFVSPEPLARWLVFDPTRFPNAISGLATYPLLVGGSIISVLIDGLMLYWFGGSLERSWGAARYVLFLLATDAAAALLWLGGVLLFGGSPAAGASGTPWFLISSVIVAWAWLNPDETILFWFVLPLQARWIGWLTIALLYFNYASLSPVNGVLKVLLGCFALGGVAASWAYVHYQRTWGWIPRRRPEAKPKSRVLRHPSSTFFGALTRPWREWQRRRRIAHLQRTFILEDEDQGKR